MARRLYLDTVNGRFVQGLNSTIPVTLDNLFQNDAATYELYFLRPDPTGAFVYEAQDFAAKSVKLHIAPPAPSTATAYVAQNTWTDLPATVTASVTRTITGGTTANEQQTLAFTPEAQSGTFSLTIPSRTVTIADITGGTFTTSGGHGLANFEPFTITGLSSPTGGLANGQSLFVASVLNAGQFTATPTANGIGVTAFAASSGTLSTLTASTRLLPARAAAADVQTALEALPSVAAGNVLVLGIPGSEYRIGYQGQKSQVQLPVATVAASLTPVFGKTATINFATAELAAAISASASIEAALEIEVTEGSTVETLLQTGVTLRNDIITTAGALPSAVSPSTSFLLTSPDESVWSVSIDDDGTLSATKQ